MDKTYRIGVRYRKYKYLSIAVNCAIVFTFYFIYRFLLEEAFPKLVGAPLALLFLLLGVIVARVTAYFADKYAAQFGYRVTPEGLIAETWGRTTLYAWDSFSAAELREFQFRGVFPVEFQVGGKPMMLNQHVDGLCELTGEIFRRIEPHAKVDPALVKRAEDLRGVY